MDGYYTKQAQLPHFTSGYVRQRGSGIGALVAGVGRVALPFVSRVVIPGARTLAKYVLPTAKKMGKEFISQALPEVVEVFAKRKSPKQALKSSISKTVTKQLGGGATTRRRKGAKSKKKTTNQTAAASRASVNNRKRCRGTSANRSSRAGELAKRSRQSFFSNVQDDY